MDEITRFSPTPIARVSGRSRVIGSMVLERLLAKLEFGRLSVRLPNGEWLTHVAPQPGPEARMVLVRWRALQRLAFGGDIGFGMSFIDGDWTSPNLPQVVELAALNDAPLAAALAGSRAMRLVQRVRHAFNRNTRRGARRNIVAHYDLGNAFYARFLDAGMSYSSALYEDDRLTLDQAQRAKQDRVVELLEAPAGARVLEIGCGWGGLAERLIETDCTVTALTLSPAQEGHIRENQPASVADGSLDVRLQDYREVEGAYDAIVSIEMLEAVGEVHWPVYFERLRSLLKPGGRAVIQAITIDDSRFEAYRRTPDFIQTHVFPGGMLPSVPVLECHVAQAGLRIVHSQHFGRSYARTLAEWRSRFTRATQALLAEGTDPKFLRKWDYYLGYCEGGFLAGSIDVGLFVLEHAATAET